jgi:hypothetical protein
MLSSERRSPAGPSPLSRRGARPSGTDTTWPRRPSALPSTAFTTGRTSSELGEGQEGHPLTRRLAAEASSGTRCARCRVGRTTRARSAERRWRSGTGTVSGAADPDRCARGAQHQVGQRAYARLSQRHARSRHTARTPRHRRSGTGPTSNRGHTNHSSMPEAAQQFPYPARPQRGQEPLHHGLLLRPVHRHPRPPGRPACGTGVTISQRTRAGRMRTR